ncbi:rhomboid family protein [bacterium]|nr:rhomboid family protein [bacterium]
MTHPHSVKDTRCLIHPEREAAALCLSCGQYFCRECVTEHKGKVLCTLCLNKEKDSTARKRRLPRLIRAGLAIITGLIVCYILFYSLGTVLSLITDAFH